MNKWDRFKSTQRIEREREERRRRDMWEQGLDLFGKVMLGLLTLLMWLMFFTH